MRKTLQALAPALAVAGMLVAPLTAGAVHEDDPSTRNIHAMGESPNPASLATFPTPGPIAAFTANSDLAFWGKYAIQGTYDGFRIIDISAPGNPREVTHFKCFSDQGDITVWGNLLFRSVNSPLTTPICSETNTRSPSGVPGFEGLQIIDISDVRAPKQVGWVATDCGSHTQTLVPDLKHNRLLIYVSTSGVSNLAPSPFGNRCTSTHGRFDIVEVPLDHPDAAHVIGSAPLGTTADGRLIRSCHDIGVILGDVNLAACAGNPESVVFDIRDPAHPVRLYSVTDPTVTSWHSAAFTWDGKVLVLGWEPGGGGRPRCLATGQVDPGTRPATTDDVVVTDAMKTIFFHDAGTGAPLGGWTLPRPQTLTENCTIHNYNVLPIRGRYVLVHGSYQSGTSMVEFTDPANPVEIAYSDPLPLDEDTLVLGGAWSTYYYNNFIYESDIVRGLRVYRVSDRAGAAAMRLPFLNPQTQDFSLP